MPSLPPGSATPHRKRIDPDDTELDFPDEGATDDTKREPEDAWDPGDDSDLGLGSTESEDVGLDTATGIDDTQDHDGELDETGEGVRWTTDSEADDDLPGTEADLLSGDEYGWTGEDEPSDSDDDDFDPGIDDDAPAAADDGGVEGLDDDTELDDVDLTNLPAMDADAEEEGDGIGDAAWGELSEVSLVEDPVTEVAPGVSWKLLPERAVRRTWVATLEHPAQALAALAERVVLYADGVALVEEAGLRRIVGTSPDAERFTGLALCNHEGVALTAVATEHGIRIVRDDRTSSPPPPNEAAIVQVGFTHKSQGLTLWSLDTQGVLSTSDDDAVSWNELSLPHKLFSFATDGERRIVALARAAAEPTLRIAHSSDAGRTFAWRDLPDLALLPETSWRVQMLCRDAVLVTADQQRVYCSFADAAFAEVVAHARGPATLVDEDDEIIVYACVPQAERLLIARRPARNPTATPTVVCSCDAATVGEPLALCAHYAEGLVTLYLATASGLHRIEASLDGEQLA